MDDSLPQGESDYAIQKFDSDYDSYDFSIALRKTSTQLKMTPTITHHQTKRWNHLTHSGWRKAQCFGQLRFQASCSQME